MNPEATAGNQWKVSLRNAYPVSQYSVQTLTYEALLTNHGSKFEFIFLGQPIPSIVTQETYDAKGTQKAIKSWKSKFKDVTVKTGLEDNRMYLTAEYSYTGGVSDGDIRSRLKYLFQAGSGVMDWSFHGRKDGMKVVKKRAKGKLTHLTKTDFIVIVDDPDWNDDDPKAQNWDPYEIEVAVVLRRGLGLYLEESGRWTCTTTAIVWWCSSLARSRDRPRRRPTC